VTGEHTVVMLRELQRQDVNAWLPSFVSDFRLRFASLLGYELRDMPLALALCKNTDLSFFSTMNALDPPPSP
jgi:tRNA(Met) C34 N-acetyltransferase TmcA